jgi:hypothetical protein
MAYNIVPGVTNILATTAGSTISVGQWYKVDPNVVRNGLAFQAILQASSVGATASSTVYIEVSNDGATPLSTTPCLNLGLTNTSTTFISAGGCLASSFAGAFAYVRANMTSLTTSTAGSAGSPSVNVTVGAQAYP